MKSPSWILSLRSRLAAPRPATPDIRLRVTNVTRDTILATHMEVADSGPKRNKGLLGRTHLDPGEGLWIVPCEAVHTIGMKFPIDLVYLDRNHRVKKLRREVPPWRLSACLSAHSILELAPGALRNTLTAVGDTLQFSPASETGEGSSITNTQPGQGS
jgi:uncharacterized membrane protein (UPF0127 family)